MESQDFERLESLYFELESRSDAERARRIAELEQERPELAARLRAMLEVGGETSGDLIPVPSLPEPEPGSRVGSFRLLHRIGEGGMGLVYEAEQTEPVRRRAAVKLVKPGLDSRAILSRFEAERRALARMEHPSIASVYEAGATDDGRPYFAMELVDGLPINVFCERHRLRTEDRLRLLMSVCAAVQHAHRKGVIHRDLKPSNILVRESGTGPQVKVIDFGIAKAIADVDDLATQFTRHGQLVGTLEYMSPEQVRGVDVDTRSDVYSLGVLLYELLVGTVPLAGRDLRAAGFDEMRNLVQSFETPRPSERIDRTTEIGREVAAQRQTDPASLVRTLRRDLDWVVLKALAKERDQRYESPSDLAEEIQRVLEHEPVQAGPPTLNYRARKFVRRHRVGVAIASVLLLAMLVGVGGLAAGLVRARAAEKVAVQESEVTGEVLEFFRGVLAEGAQETAEGRILDTRELFERARRRLEEDPPSDPRVYGSVLIRIGEFFQLDTEDNVAAVALYDRAIEALDGLEEARSELALAFYRKAVILRITGDLDGADDLLERSLSLRPEGSEGSRDPVPMAEVLAEQAQILRARRQLDEALETIRRSASMAEAGRGPRHQEVIAKRQQEAGILLQMGRTDEAYDLQTEMIELAREEEYWRTLSVLHNDRAVTSYRRGDLVTAYENFEQALEINRERLGGDNLQLAGQLSNLAVVAATLGEYERSEEVMRQALDAMAGRTEPGSVMMLISRQLLGETMLRAGKYDAARGEIEGLLPLAYDNEALDGPVGPFRAERNLAFLDGMTGAPRAAAGRLEGALSRSTPWHERDPVGSCGLAVDLLAFDSTRGPSTAEVHCGEAWADPRTQHSLARALALRGEHDAALDLIDALEPRRFVSAWHGDDPAFEGLRNDPRFRAFLEATDPRRRAD